MSTDPFNLQRFIDAQSASFDQARRELAAGRKRSHWVWFIFPQLQGLGYSAMAQKYALSGLPEAEAYLEHPQLGPRLRECVGLVNACAGRSLEDVLGAPDDLKFHSCVTLFARAGKSPQDAVFADALKIFFSEREDPGTVRQL